MLLGIEAAERRIWLVKPNYSFTGIASVAAYTLFASAIAFCQTVRSRKCLVRGAANG
jgi:hypothetical protein